MAFPLSSQLLTQSHQGVCTALQIYQRHQKISIDHVLLTEVNAFALKMQRFAKQTISWLPLLFIPTNASPLWVRPRSRFAGSVLTIVPDSSCHSSSWPTSSIGLASTAPCSSSSSSSPHAIGPTTAFSTSTATGLNHDIFRHHCRIHWLKLLSGLVQLRIHQAEHPLLPQQSIKPLQLSRLQ